MFCYFPAEPGSQQVAVITAASMGQDHDEHATTNTIKQAVAKRTAARTGGGFRRQSHAKQ
jgi:hypothetical protein